MSNTPHCRDQILFEAKPKQKNKPFGMGGLQARVSEYCCFFVWISLFFWFCCFSFFPSFQPVARFGLPDSQGPLSYSATQTPSHLGLAKGDILLRGSVYRIRKDQSSYSAHRTSSHLGLPKLYYTNTECLIWNNHVLLTFLQQPFFWNCHTMAFDFTTSNYLPTGYHPHL